MSEIDPINVEETINEATKEVTSAKDRLPAQSQITGSTTITSMEELKDRAPEVYKAMLEGIAVNIINDMEDHQERIKEINREARRDSGE